MQPDPTFQMTGLTGIKMKYLSLIILTISSFGFNNLYAQQKNLRGIIKDEANLPLIGATVLVDKTKNFAVTDVNGNFNLNLTELPVTLVINYIGYRSYQITIAEIPDQALEIQLNSDQTVLNEIVVVGYGTQNRRELIGSVSKVNPAETKNIQVGSVDAQLQGKISGVQISSSTGVPGETSNIRVRGATSINASNDPLYVIDGVFINSNSLQTINTGGKATSPLADISPADIESIEVLKDAEATSLFGSRGANGVIIITTKRGDYNQKAKINFNTSHGYSKAGRLWDLASGPEHAQLVNEWWVNTGIDNPSLNRSHENRPYRPVSEGGRGLPEEQQTYDRLSELFRTASVHNYDLSVSGGTNGTRYYIGGSYSSQEAIIRPIDFSRAGFKVNLDQKISDKIEIGVSNTFSRTHRNQARAGDGPRGGLLQAALHSPTVLSPYNEQGQLVGRAGFDNLTLMIDHYDVNSVSLRYIGNLYLEAELSPDLKFRSSFGADYNDYDENEYWNTFLIEGSQGGLATSSISKNSLLLNEQTLSYRKKITGGHNIGILLGNSLQSEVLAITSAEGRGFANNEFRLISSASTTVSSQSWTKNTLASFFSRADYNYASKYLFNFSFRADGSSRFGQNNRWGYFPAVGAAWRLKEESFLSESRTISDLKLKATFGYTGIQNGIGNFASHGLWSGGAFYQNQPGIAPQQLGNQDLRWERTRQLNIGADIGLFNNRLSLEVNFYDKYTTDGLLRLPLPGTTGFSSYWSNAIDISNKGFELAINSINFESRNFSWSTNFNIARNVNKIEKLESPLRFGSRDLILQQEGYPLYSFWVYKELYVDPQNGNVVYDDVNKDGAITVEDRQIVGSIWPDFFGGLTNTLRYKNFDLNAFFSFQYGNKIYNHNAFFGGGLGARDEARVIFKDNVRRWQNPGDVTDIPRPDGININNYRDGGSRWLEDGSFLRLRSLDLGYTIPSHLIPKIGKIDRARIYVSGTNLLLFTNYTGADPESSASAGQNSQGIDLGTPPQPRTILFGVNLTL